MPLDTGQQQYVRNWVTRWHGGPPRCGLCGQQDWTTWEIEGAGVQMSPPRRPTGLDPAIVLICQQCGSMLWLDFQVVRLPPGQAPPPSGE